MDVLDEVSSPFPSVRVLAILRAFSPAVACHVHRLGIAIARHREIVRRQ